AAELLEKQGLRGGFFHSPRSAVELEYLRKSPEQRRPPVRLLILSLEEIRMLSALVRPRRRLRDEQHLDPLGQQTKLQRSEPSSSMIARNTKLRAERALRIAVGDLGEL